jgi:DNA-binding transcriptional ArsR family regulator
MAQITLNCWHFKTMIRKRRLRTSSELRVLASPERTEILQALQGRPPMSVREIGEALGRLPVSLYYHLHALARAGLVERAGPRPAARGKEALYALRAAQLTIQPDVRGPGEIAAMRKIAAGVFRRAQRLNDAIVGERPARRRLRREHVLAQRTVRLDAKGLERINRLLLELLEQMRHASHATGGRFYTVTLHLVRSPHRR